MRSFAVRPGDGVSQSKWGCIGCGRASFFMRSKAGWCSFNCRPKALAIDSYVISSWLQRGNVYVSGLYK